MSDIPCTRLDSQGSRKKKLNKTVSDLDSPDGLVHGVVELEAEAILLGRPLYQLAGVEQDGAHPVVCLRGLIDQENPRLQGTPQLGPALQRATDLKNRMAPTLLTASYWTNGTAWELITSC